MDLTIYEHIASAADFGAAAVASALAFRSMRKYLASDDQLVREFFYALFMSAVSAYFALNGLDRLI